MAIGPGKYDDLCTYVRQQVGLIEGGGLGGGVVIMVLGGNRGSGFSVQADLRTTAMLPDLIEEMARALRNDLNS